MRAFFIISILGYKFKTNTLLTYQYIIILCNSKTHDIPPQNTTHLRTPYYACHNTNTNSINQEKEKANLYRNRGTIYPINPYIL